MGNKKFNHNLQIYVDKAIESFREAKTPVVNPTEVALKAMTFIDPENESLALVTFGCTLTVRKMAGDSLANQYKKQPLDAANGNLFDRLQHMYPAMRDNEKVFVMREYLTIEERRTNSARLRKEAAAKNEHADLLDAETDQLIIDGVFGVDV